MTYSLYKVRKPRMTKLGQGVGVRAHYPITLIPDYFLFSNSLPWETLVGLLPVGSRKKCSFNDSAIKKLGEGKRRAYIAFTPTLELNGRLFSLMARSLNPPPSP